MQYGMRRELRQQHGTRVQLQQMCRQWVHLPFLVSTIWRPRRFSCPLLLGRGCARYELRLERFKVQKDCHGRPFRRRMDDYRSSCTWPPHLVVDADCGLCAANSVVAVASCFPGSSGKLHGKQPRLWAERSPANARPFLISCIVVDFFFLYIYIYIFFGGGCVVHTPPLLYIRIYIYMHIQIFSSFLYLPPSFRLLPSTFYLLLLPCH